MKKIGLIGLLLGWWSLSSGQRVYQEMMNDPSVNFYDVCAEAERYFSTHDPSEKGSGWKGYQRWRDQNEYKYYPSGDRSQVDPAFAEKQWQAFLANNPSPNRLFSGGWEELGPSVVDNITGHYAAGLGRVEDVYVNPVNSSQLYIGSRSGGFWKTLDGGFTWQGGSTDFLVASGVNTIAVSPTYPDSILINIRNATNGYSHGIYRSVDGGNTWVQSNFHPGSVGFGGLGSDFSIYQVAFHPTVPNLVFVGTSRGLYRSTDNLASWTRSMNDGEIQQITFHPTDPNVVYLLDQDYWNGNRDSVFRSTDLGQTFAAVSGIPGNNNDRGRLAASADCPDCIYFASPAGVFRSLNQGLNFDFLSNPGVGTAGFAVNDQDTSQLVVGNIDVYNSSDGGRTFNQTSWWYLGSAANGSGTLAQNFVSSPSYVHADIRIARSVNGTFYIGTDGYACMSNSNGAVWNRLSRGTAIRENYCLGTSQSNHYVTICGSQDNGTSIKNQAGWVEFYGADGMEGIVHPLNYDWMIGSFQYGGRRRTLDGGLTQSGITPSGQSGSGNGAWVAPFLYDPNEQMRVFNFSNFVYVSEDFGDSWTYRGSPATFTGAIELAAIAENNPFTVVIAQGEKIEKSLNGGATFSSIQNGLPNASIRDIAFDPNDDETMVVVYARYQNDGNKVFLTQDGGATWTNITHNLGDMPIRSVVIDHTPESNIYLGAEIGVFVKPMADNSWALFNTDLPNASIRELEVNYGSNTLKAVTWGRGLWEWTLKDRADYPAILLTETDHLPTFDAPKEGVDQYVRSVISYGDTLSSVFLEWSLGAPTFGNVIPMTNTSDSTWTSDQPLPNAQVGTRVYFKVYAVGSNNDTTETYKFMYRVRPFEYCNATGSTGTGSDYINYVELNGMSNPSGQDYYGNFRNIVVDLWKDSTYTLQVELAFAFAPDSCLAWIDYDKDAVFEEWEEIPMSAFNSSSQSFGTFTVPAGAAFGDTVVLRIRNSYAANPEPCGTVAGEVEDYSIALKAVGCAINTGIQVNGDTVTAQASSGSFQWIDCGNGNVPVAGATGSSFVPTVDGDYAVVISDSGCVDTSACVTMVVTALDNGWDGPQVTIRPNPGSGDFVLDLGQRYEAVELRVWDARGKLMQRIAREGLAEVPFRFDAPAGMYWVEVLADGQRVATRLVMQ